MIGWYPTSGRLYLAMNDVAGTFNDNRGAIDVMVYRR
jgi:hypothetical protein